MITEPCALHGKTELFCQFISFSRQPACIEAMPFRRQFPHLPNCRTDVFFELLGDTGFVFIRRTQIFDPFPDQSDWVIFLCAYGEFDSFNFLIF